MAQFEELTDKQFAALRDLINTARIEQVQRLPSLKQRVISLGHSVEDVEAATQYWADYELEKRRRGVCS